MAKEICSTCNGLGFTTLMGDYDPCCAGFKIYCEGCDSEIHNTAEINDEDEMTHICQPCHQGELEAAIENLKS